MPKEEMSQVDARERSYHIRQRAGEPHLPTKRRQEKEIESQRRGKGLCRVLRVQFRVPKILASLTTLAETASLTWGKWGQWGQCVCEDCERKQ